MKHRLRAFSILEILVAIGVAAVLLILSVSGVKNVVLKSQQLRCLSNLRQLFLAHQSWMTDHNMTLPLGYKDAAYYAYGSSDYQREFSGYLPSRVKGRFTGMSEPYLCPSDREIRGNPGQPGHNGYSYGGNGFMARQNQNVASRWTLPAKTFFMADSISSFVYASSSSYLSQIDWRHSAKANFIFLDGHTEFLPPAAMPAPAADVPFWNAEY